MPTDNSYKVAIPNWEEILAACAEHADTLPDLTTELASLKGFLDKAKTLKVQQESSKAARQGTTQELKQAIKDGQEVARRIRDAAKFKIGQRNERLVQFKVKPLRARPRKAAAATKPETQAPEDASAGSAAPAKP
jgi:hypothetical protein